MVNITISGTPGSGKSVVGIYLSKRLNFKYYGIGELMRNFARKKKLDLIEFSLLLDKNEKLDKFFNEKIKKLNKENNFVLDSRLGFLFIKKGIHIFLDADLDVRARRIFKDKRKLENYRNINKIRKEIKKRLLLEKKRFKRLYDVNFTDLRYYDLVINTKGMNVEMISKIILRFLKK